MFEKGELKELLFPKKLFHENFFYKILIVSIAAILVFKLTIGKEINQINENFNIFFLLMEERKQ